MSSNTNNLTGEGRAVLTGEDQVVVTAERRNAKRACRRTEVELAIFAAEKARLELRILQLNLRIDKDIPSPTAQATTNPEALFRGFSGCPPEVRQKIWKYAFPDGRVITFGVGNIITPRPSIAGAPTQEKYYGYQAYVEYEEVGLLAACQESRFVAKKFYKLAFGPILNNKKIYFNPSNDIVHIGGNRAFTAMQKLAGSERNLVRFLAFGGDRAVWLGHLKSIKKSYPNLERLFLPLEPGTGSTAAWEVATERAVHQGRENTLGADYSPLFALPNVTFYRKVTQPRLSTMLYNEYETFMTPGGPSQLARDIRR